VTTGNDFAAPCKKNVTCDNEGREKHEKQLQAKWTRGLLVGSATVTLKEDCEFCFYDESLPFMFGSFVSCRLMSCGGRRSGLCISTDAIITTVFSHYSSFLYTMSDVR
jgi:hypothetical protein